MSSKVTLATAGNVLVPAYLALLQRGFGVRRDPPASPEHEPLWHAESEAAHLIAEDPFSLLALAAIAESRGSDWQASDEEIASFLLDYPEQEAAA